VRAAVACAVASLPRCLLAALATDSLGSRCVLQPALKTLESGGEASGAVRRALCCEALKDRWGAAAGDAVGQHTLRVAFGGGDLATKEAIASELAPIAKTKLVGSSAGRSSMRLVQVDVFSKRKVEWVQAVQRGQTAAKLLSGITESSAKKGREGHGQQPERKPDGWLDGRLDRRGAEETSSSREKSKRKPTARSMKKRDRKGDAEGAAEAKPKDSFLEALGFGGGFGEDAGAGASKRPRSESKGEKNKAGGTSSLSFLRSVINGSADGDTGDPVSQQKKKKKKKS